ncbi:galectin-related protein-like [Cynoglossus semilaevis]|uniref:Galectin n=1 Tax=Cynoglossus semilaevis TaxID=244447 RepID=A0A3P8UZX2_CYNSE|nr:galectin-related protein-like [Cynoglossus semilaevis]
MAVQAAENDSINVEDDHLNDSLGNPGLISPDKEDLSRLLTVPFSGRIRGGMRPGKKIIVMGIIDLEPESFDISLTCGRDSEKEEKQQRDVALKLTARFGDRQFLRMACVSGKWTEEEASTVYFPFIPDQPFRVRRPCFCPSGGCWCHARLRDFISYNLRLFFVVLLFTQLKSLYILMQTGNVMTQVNIYFYLLLLCFC